MAHEPLQASFLTAAIERAQKKVEEHNFGIRKHTLEYDDVMNVHREVIHRQRREILDKRRLKDTILGHGEDMVADLVAQHAGGELQSENWDLETLYEEVDRARSTSATWSGPRIWPESRRMRSSTILPPRRRSATTRRKRSSRIWGSISATPSARSPSTDRRQKLVEHLNAMDYLREGIHLRGYAQQDPPVAYKKEADEMFQTLLKSIQDDMVNWMFHLVVQPVRPQPVRRRLHPRQRGRRA